MINKATFLGAFALLLLANPSIGRDIWICDEMPKGTVYPDRFTNCKHYQTGKRYKAASEPKATLSAPDPAADGAKFQQSQIMVNAQTGAGISKGREIHLVLTGTDDEVAQAVRGCMATFRGRGSCWGFASTKDFERADVIVGDGMNRLCWVARAFRNNHGKIDYEFSRKLYDLDCWNSG